MTTSGAPESAGAAGRPAPGTRIEAVLTAPAAGGEAVVHTDSGTVFAAGGLPGERVVVELDDVRPRFARGRVIAVLDPSPHRVPDRRDLLGAPGVGGMEYAAAALAYSRELKGRAAADQLQRIGGIAWGVAVEPAPLEADAEAALAQEPGDRVGDATAAPGDPGAGARTESAWRIGTQWRTRVQLAVDPNGRPGMLAPGSHTVVSVDHVPLAVPEIDDARVQDLALPGASRIELAVGTDSGALVVTGPATQEAIARLAAVARDRGWSLVHRGRGQRNRGGSRAGGGRGPRRGRPGAGNGSRTGTTLLEGPGHVVQRVAGLDYRVRADGFWQVHVDAAAVLGDRVAKLAAGARSVVDLYCGAGLFSLRLAAAGARVTGVEGSPGAVADARENAARLLGPADAGAEFSVARVETLPTLPAADTIVADPPRAGLGRAVTDLITASAAERLVYVSCDGGTLARDAKALTAHGFRLAGLSAHDLFPLTGHVEFVSEFVR